MAKKTTNQSDTAKNFLDNHELLRKTMKNLNDSYRMMDTLRTDGGNTLKANAKNIADIVNDEDKLLHKENNAIIESSLKQFGLTRDDIEQTYYQFNKSGFAIDTVTNQYTRMHSRNWLKQILAEGVQPQIFKDENRAQQCYYKAEMDDAMDEISVNHLNETNIVSIHQD